jgi:hypothetical protein
MSLARRWFDPIRSRWQLKRRVRLHRHRLSSSRGPLTVYLRLDDAYSYLTVQLLLHLEEQLIDRYKPLRVVICTQSPAIYPHDLTTDAWLRYTLADAAVLAKQHRFIFQPHSHPPDAALMLRALDILRLTALIGRPYLQLLQNVFHMLWQRQTGKLDTLHQMAMRRKNLLSRPTDGRIRDQVLLAADIEFDHKHYRAIDDLLRLTRHLKRAAVLKEEPVFLINHIEWQEHLVSDPVNLANIQARHADLHVYLALEDPLSWLILSYLQRDMAGYYNVQLHVHPLPYQHKDEFDWAQAARLSRRVDVPFGPFCRPDAAAVAVMSMLLYATPPAQRVDQLLSLLRGVWTQGLDVTFAPHLNRLGLSLPTDISTESQQWLLDHAQACGRLQRPELPTMVLTIGSRTHAFCGIYRVWQVETLLAESLLIDTSEMPVQP